MQKNLVWAVILSAIVYIGWFSYMDKKMAPQRAAAIQARQAAIAAQQAAAAEKANNTAGGVVPAAASVHIPSASNAKVPQAKDTSWKKNAVSVKAGKAEYIFDSETASVRQMIYQGPVEPVELVPETSAGFFLLSDSSGSAFDFKKSSQNGTSVEFTAKSGKMLITKKYELDENNALNNLKISFKNTGHSEITVYQ